MFDIAAAMKMIPEFSRRIDALEARFTALEKNIALILEILEAEKGEQNDG